MQAMVLKQPRAALEWTELADLQPGPGEIRVKVSACGVCRTDLHVVDGELPNPRLSHKSIHRVATHSGSNGSSIEARSALLICFDHPAIDVPIRFAVGWRSYRWLSTWIPWTRLATHVRWRKSS
jgi:hypothetical protein